MTTTRSPVSAGGVGRGAGARAGLEGQVEAEAYARSSRDGIRSPASSCSPAPRQVYVRPDGSERRAEPVLGYDVRFSAPKSVSLI